MSAPKRSTLIKALKKLARRRFKDGAPGFSMTFTEHSDRAVAIILGTYVEDKLRVRLEGEMMHLSEDESRDLFEERGPLADFAAKVQIGYAMKLYGPRTKEELGSIREIRNAFAHSAGIIDFSTKEVSDLVGVLSFPQIAGTLLADATPRTETGEERKTENRPIDLFGLSCAALSNVLELKNTSL